MLALLPESVLERLAMGSELVTVPAGQDVFREGDPGDRFYVIESGRVDVSIRGEFIRTQLAGESFGEIALLRDIPRTASATARVDCVLLALDQDAFLEAVTGNSDSQNAAEAIVSRRLLQA